MNTLLRYGLLMALLALLPTGVQAAQGPLDGMTFVGTNGEAGKPLDPDEHEELTFHDGLFTSISCAPYNFSSSPYTTRVKDNAIHFSAVTESPTHGTISWQGVVTGDTAEVTFVWTKERWYWNTRREYWFLGTLKEQVASGQASP